MKDATGELSMTAIAVVAIAAIGVVFSQLVWPAIKKNITRSAHCSESFGCSTSGGNVLLDCYFMNESGTTETVQCPAQDA